MMIMLAGCNTVYVRPGTMTQNTKVYAADRGGYTMRRAIKHELEDRGYRVVVGRAVVNTSESDGDDKIKHILGKVPFDAKYFVNVEERKEYPRPIWCALNGFWWWRFNVSITDQTTGEEIMTWRGHGCADSSVRKLHKIMDRLEAPNDTPEQ